MERYNKTYDRSGRGRPLSDEIIQKTIDQLLKPDVTLVELTTLVEMKTECPFPEKILFAAETATSRQNRKVKGDYCVYELKLTGAFKNIIDKEERDTLLNKGIILNSVCLKKTNQ